MSKIEVKEVGTAPDPVKEPEVKTEPKTEPVTEPVKEPDPVKEPEPKTEPVKESEVKTEPTPDPVKDPEPKTDPAPDLKPELEKLTRKVDELKNDNKALTAKLEALELTQRLQKANVKESEMDVVTLLIEKERVNKDFDEKKYITKLKAEKPYLFMVEDTVTARERKVETRTVPTAAEASKRALEILKGWTRN